MEPCLVEFAGIQVRAPDGVLLWQLSDETAADVNYFGAASSSLRQCHTTVQRRHRSDRGSPYPRDDGRMGYTSSAAKGGY